MPPTSTIPTLRHDRHVEDDTPSGVRLISPRPDWLHERSCSVCGIDWGTRPLPRASGPSYCRDCVADAPVDDFDAVYTDLGGRG